MTIYILRHGETEFNRLGLVQGSGVDSDLNATGLQQAQAFFDLYQAQAFDLVVTSRLKRTHQTVRFFLDREIPWIQTEDLNEICWGEHEGQSGTPERIAIYRQVIGEWQAGNLDAALPGGETARELSLRVERFIAWLRGRPERRILVCTHGRTMRCLIALLKEQALSEMETVQHANTGCYVVHLQDQRFVFELENDTRHLDRALSV